MQTMASYPSKRFSDNREAQWFDAGWQHTRAKPTEKMGKRESTYPMRMSPPVKRLNSEPGPSDACATMTTYIPISCWQVQSARSSSHVGSSSKP